MKGKSDLREWRLSFPLTQTGFAGNAIGAENWRAAAAAAGRAAFAYCQNLGRSR
jgi:hypothetical protein